MADQEDESASRPSHDSLSSVSTTSLVFDRIQEQTEKGSTINKSSWRSKTAFTDHDSDYTLKGEDQDYDDDDVETGPFLGGRTSSTPAPTQPKRAGTSLRKLCIIMGSVCAVAWAATAATFVFKGSYKHASDSDHDPDASHRGSGKTITLEQVLGQFWAPTEHSISWIASPDGEDGLLLEQGASDKDYLVVEDVRANKNIVAARDDGGPTELSETRTLMKNGYFDFEGRHLVPAWLEPSPNLKKVLIGVDRVRNWRHSFTASYFIYDVETEKVEPLVPSDSKATVQLAGWSPKSDAVSFTQNNNLYIRHLKNNDKNKNNEITQITDDGGPEYFYGIPDWVYEEEVFSGRSATWWSDDGKYLAFLRTNETGVPEYPLQFFVSRPSGDDPRPGEETYPDKTLLKYPRAGSHNPVVDVQFYDVARGEVFSVYVDNQFPDDDRLINGFLWAGDQALIKQTNRVSDVLQTTLVDVASRTGKTTSTVDIGAIDGGWFEISQRMAFVPADPDNNRPHNGYVDTVIRDDGDHLAYFTPLDNPEPVMLTSGPWEVEEAPSAIDLANNLVYFTATKESSIQRHIYSVKLDGSDLHPLTDASTEGYYGASFSSGAGFALLSYRGPRIPYQKVISTPSNKAKYDHVIEDNKSLADLARKYQLPVLKYGTLDLGDGVKVNYVERRPPHFDPKKRHPVLFQQYSGPGSQSVTKKFAVTFESYVAAALGYLVVTVDPRGTGFLGRKHRVVVRDRLGVIEAADHIAAARHFASLPYVDPSRLAIWGWSYGGFQTLKTLEQDAGATYSYGMAVAPVTDWAYYDSVYTNRYMRTPDANRAGYDASRVSNASALAENTRFLIMHGTGDDNVHFQNTLALLDELDLKGIDNYDVHVFPDSDHSIYYHNANKVVYSKLNKWLINAFNGEWLKTANPKPNPLAKRLPATELW